MEEVNGNFIIYGVSRNDPKCIHTVDQAIEYINQIGFLPLFKNEIEGFSLEERSVPEDWWSDDASRDPWMWRTIIAGKRDIAYGKFFDKKAGFISRQWLPYFVNYRRDGYDFEALYEDGKAQVKLKYIMEHFYKEGEKTEIFSNELKQIAGFGKDGMKGFDGAVTKLMMMTYLCNCDFKKRKNKKGQEFGWDVAIYTTPETLWGYDYVTSAYQEKPEESFRRIADYLKEKYPQSTDQQIKKVIK